MGTFIIRFKYHGEAREHEARQRGKDRQDALDQFGKAKDETILSIQEIGEI